MPQHPHLHGRVSELRSSVFAILAEKMAQVPGRIYPLHIGDTYRLPPAAALMVGDSPQDVAMARAAGCGACAVTYGLRSREELAAAAPDFLLEDLRDLPRRIL